MGGIVILLKKIMSVACCLAILFTTFQSVYATTPYEFSPETVTQLPADDWVLIEDHQLGLYGSATTAADPAATNGSAAKLGSKDNGWSIQLESNILPQEGTWDVYVRMRIDNDPVAAPTHAFVYGHYLAATGAENYQWGSIDTFADEQYHYQKLAFTYDPSTGSQKYFFNTENASSAALYIDHVYVVKQTVGTPEAPPSFLDGMSPDDWVFVEDNQLGLWGSATTAADSAAANGSAAKVGSKDYEWSIQLESNILPQEGTWDVYVRMRIDNDPGAAPTHAFKYGRYLAANGAENYGFGSNDIFGDEQYHYQKLAFAYEPNKGSQKYFFNTENASSAALYVDHIYLVKQNIILPEFLEGLPTDQWMQFEENEFDLYNPAALVSDGKADNGMAAKLPGNTDDWAIQLPKTKLPQEKYWEVYARVRIDAGSVAPDNAGFAFNYGFYNVTQGSKMADYADYSDGEYHYLKFPWIIDSEQADQRYLFFSMYNSLGANLYVDKFYAVSYTPETKTSIPDFAVWLPAEDWLTIEESQFDLQSPAAIRDDKKAMNYKAAQLAGNVNTQAIQIPGSALPAAGEWKIYADVYVEQGQAPSGAQAFSAGIEGATSQSASFYVPEQASDKYQTIQLPWTYDAAAANPYIWFSTNGASIQNLKIDRIYLAKYVAQLPTEVPAFVSHLNTNDWMSIEENQFQVAAPAAIVGDTKAWNQQAVQIPGKTAANAVTIEQANLPSTGKWKLYANVRVESGLASNPNALKVGLSPNTTEGTSISKAPLASGEYRYVEIPWIYDAAVQTDAQLFFNTADTQIDKLLIDRIIAVKYEEEAADTVTIVDDRVASAVIVYPEKADQKVIDSARTLQRYVQESTGASLQVMSRDWALALQSNINRIYVGFNPYKNYADQLSALKKDGFIIDAGDKSITIIGADKWSTEFGVYRFLEKYAGAVWLMPGPDGEDVRPSDTISVPGGLFSDEPDAIGRHFFGTEAEWGLHANAEWAVRNLMHNSLNFHHNMNKLFDPAVFSDHPEYYPGGKIPTHAFEWQVCFNDQTSAAAVARIVEFFRNNPDEISYSLAINDSKNYCASDIARASGVNSMGALDLSDVYYAWVNDVAEGVTTYNNGEFADKYFGLLAYWNVLEPPSFSLHENVVPYLTVDRMTWGKPDEKVNGHALTEAWAAVAANLGFYEYIYGSQYHVPRMYMETLSDMYKYAAEHKVIGHVGELFPNFGGEGAKPWALAKLQWDANLDVNDLTYEWYERAVGEGAAPYLEQYYAIWENFWTHQIFDTEWYNDWANREIRENWLPFNDLRYLQDVTEEDLTHARELMEQVVAHAGAGRQKVRADKMMKSFEYYEASAKSFPRTSAAEPANLEQAEQYLAFIKASPAYAKTRVQLRNEFMGDPILEISDYLNPAYIDGVQTKMIEALSSYLDKNPQYAALRTELNNFLEGIEYQEYSAAAVKTAADKEDILNTLDFSSGPWAGVQPMSDFLVMSQRTAPPAETKVYLLWDDEYLYVGYDNIDSGIHSPDVKISSTITAGGWWTSGADDSVETFIAKDMYSPYYGYMTNPLAINLLYYNAGAGQSYQPTKQIDTKAELYETGWKAVQAIPFEMIGVDPKNTDSLIGLFFRNYHGNSVYIGWGGSQPWRPDTFHTINLVKPAGPDPEPDPKIVSIDDVFIETVVGTAPILPTTVTVKYADNTSGRITVTWDAIDPASYARAGSFTVEGEAAGTSLKAIATVTVKQQSDDNNGNNGNNGNNNSSNSNNNSNNSNNNTGNNENSNSAGNLIIGKNNLQVTQETGANGVVVNKVVVASDSLAKALAEASQSASFDGQGVKVTIDATGIGGSIQLTLPGKALAEAVGKGKDTIIRVESDMAVYELPISILPLAEFAARSGVSADEVNVQVNIGPVTAELLAILKKKANEMGATLALNDAVNFNIVLSAKGQEEEFDNFGTTYTNRVLYLNNSVNPNETVAVMFDPASGEFIPVPAKPVTINGKQALELKRPGNSVYTVLSFSKKFADLDGHWAKADIERMASKLIVKGMTDTSFNPAKQITRAEFAALLVRALGLTQDAAAAAKFADVRSSAWYAGYVGAAAKYGIVTGDDNGSFAPGKEITRAEMAVMVSRALGMVQGKADVKADATILAKFKDANSMKAWATVPIAELAGLGILNGVAADTFAPDASATRAEAAVILLRAMRTLEFI